MLNLPKRTTFNFGHHFVCENRMGSSGEITCLQDIHVLYAKDGNLLGQSTNVFLYFFEKQLSGIHPDYRNYLARYQI